MKTIIIFTAACFTVSALVSLLYRLLLVLTHQRFEKVGKTTRANS
jgi:hypothetical protein